MDTLLKERKTLSAEGDRRLASAIAAIKQKGPIGLFGAGDLGRRMKEFIEERGGTVALFTDNDKSKWGAEIRGVPILPPSEAAKRRGVFFVMCSNDATAMAKQLRQLGVLKCDTTLYMACQALCHSRVSFLRHRSELAQLHALLGDGESRDVLKHLVKHAYTLDGAHIKNIRHSTQYFFSDLFAVCAGETILDAGAYTGDTVRDMVARFGAVFKEVHCFEPSRDNFTSLCAYIEHAGLRGKVIPYRLGLSNRKGLLRFSGSCSGFHMDRRVGRGGESVHTDTIDNLFARVSRRVDFIKMDIEGAEPLALEGGTALLRRDRPRLAICVYHAPEHLWEIPFFIKALVPEYRLFLRHHSKNAYETVLYATV